MLDEKVTCEEKYHSEEALIDFLLRPKDRGRNEDDDRLNKMSGELMLMLSVSFNGPHELIYENLEDINSSFDVLKKVADIDACNEFWQHDIEQKVNFFFTNTINL